MPQERAGGEDDEEEQQQARVLLRISRSVSKLTEVVEGLNAELEEVEAQGNDIACLNQIWGTYSQKAAAAAAAAAASS